MLAVSFNVVPATTGLTGLRVIAAPVTAVQGVGAVLTLKLLVAVAVQVPVPLLFCTVTVKLYVPALGLVKVAFCVVEVNPVFGLAVHV